VPGYKALPDEFIGPAAEHVRYAEVLQRAGDPHEAMLLLEASLDACEQRAKVLPGWLCGRLAALYRALKRYDDEVLLLERYRESQTSEEARTRFDARLSKARAIAERKRRTETRALASVRRVMNGREDAEMPVRSSPLADVGVFADDTVRGIRAGLTEVAHDGLESEALRDALARVRDEVRHGAQLPERMVAALKDIWRTTPRPPAIGELAWEAAYRSMLTRVLALYFEDPYA
jgi:hypothetical protein